MLNKETTTNDAMNKEAAKIAYECEVTRANQWDDGRITFDLRVNGVQISGMRYIEYTTKEGKQGSMLSFPSRKDAKTGKYYTHAWFPISRETQADIEKQIETALANK